MKSRNLVVFVKAPRIGRAKTRLAKAIGKVEAQRFYRTHLQQLCRRLCNDPRWVVWLALTEYRDVNEHTWDSRANLVMQPSGNLGKRMEFMFDHLPQGPIVLIGSDIPDVQPFHIDRAFRALGTKEAVFGPGEDGGYWLIGLRRQRRIKGAFESVRWSTEHALADTLRNLKRYSVAHVDILPDIDTGEDYRRWKTRRGV